MLVQLEKYFVKILSQFSFLFTPVFLSLKDFGKRTGDTSHEATDRSHAVVECRTEVASDFSLSLGAF